MSHRTLFLDRDGVINIDHGYVHRIEDFEFVEGIFDLCHAAVAAGASKIVVVTNQAGIARGYYSEADFHLLTDWMIERFSEAGVTIADVFYAPTHPVHGLGEYRRESADRKPGPGMLLKAAARHDLDLAASTMVGDQVTDMEAGLAAGVGRLVLIGPQTGPWRNVASVSDLARRFAAFSGPQAGDPAGAIDL